MPEIKLLSTTASLQLIFIHIIPKTATQRKQKQKQSRNEQKFEKGINHSDNDDGQEGRMEEGWGELSGGCVSISRAHYAQKYF